MIPVTIAGNTYKSISEACRVLDSPVAEITVRWRLKNGWDPTLAFTAPEVPPVDRRMFAYYRSTFDEDTEESNI